MAISVSDAPRAFMIAKSRRRSTTHPINVASTQSSPVNTINYYNSVIAKMGPKDSDSFARLYMVPGMQHCLFCPGPNWFGQTGHPTAKGKPYGVFDALEEWVDKGIAPGDIIATKYIDDDPTKGVQMTRPLCPYPQISAYKGAGDPNDAANFKCVDDEDDYERDVANALQSLAANAAFAAAGGHPAMALAGSRSSGTR